MFLNPITMKNTWLLSLLVLVFGGVSYAQTDDLYYDPDMDASYTVSYNEEYPNDDYAYDDEAYDYYDDYDYYYTQRIRRFYHPTAGFSYYSPYYMDYSYYDPFYSSYSRSGVNLNLFFGSRYYRPSLFTAWNPYGYGYGWDSYSSPWSYYSPWGYGRYSSFYSPFSSYGYYGSGWNTWCGPSYAYSPYGYSNYGYYGGYNNYRNTDAGSSRGSYYGSRRIGVNDRGTVVSTPRRTNNGLNPGLSTANQGSTVVNRRTGNERSGVVSPRTQARTSDQDRVYNPTRRTDGYSGTRQGSTASPRTTTTSRSPQVTPRTSNTPTYRSGSQRTSSSPSYRRSTTTSSSPRTYNTTRSSSPSYSPRSSSPSMNRSGSSTYRPSTPTRSSSPSMSPSRSSSSSNSSPRSSSSNSPRGHNDH